MPELNENTDMDSSRVPAFSPKLRRGTDKPLIEKRNIISSVFIAMLMGIAYQEMLSPVRDTVRNSGVSLGTVFLAGSFFLTSLRFFIGNQLHLLSDTTVGMRGDIWLFDFVAITLQSVFICFLGGVATIDVSRVIRIDFYDIVIILYLIDIVWIIAQSLLGVFIKSWRRQFVPWAWGALNSLLLFGIVAIQHGFSDPFSNAALATMLGLNVAAFVADMILIDYYDVI